MKRSERTIGPARRTRANATALRLRKALAAKSRLEAVIASAADAIISVDGDRCVTMLNPAAERMFGVAQADAIGRPVETFVPKRFRAVHRRHVARFDAKEEGGRSMGALGVVSGLRANGEEFPVEASVARTMVEGKRLFTVILRDITERRAGEEARALLAREVDHRAKNALAVVQAMVSLTNAPTREAFVEAVQGRITALARAHSLLAQSRWSGADLRQVILEEVEAYQRPGQIRLDGPPVTLAPNAVQALGLLMHELATNAVKHGALSAADGQVDIAWSGEPDRRLHIVWTENGGPPVTPPARTGFGSTLIGSVTGHQLKGHVEIDWRRAGIRVTASFPPETTRTIAEGSLPPRRRDYRPPAERLLARTGGGRKLLLVEDETLIAMQMAERMTEAGWSVLGPAGTLEEASRLLATGERPDVAVLDVNLDGTPVFPLAETLHERGVPILFCTGYDMMSEMDRFTGCAKLRKPASTEQISTEIGRMMGLGGTAAD